MDLHDLGFKNKENKKQIPNFKKNKFQPETSETKTGFNPETSGQYSKVNPKHRVHSSLRKKVNFNRNLKVLFDIKKNVNN